MTGIKLYLRDHLSFFLFQGVLVLFLLILFWLDGFRNYNTAIYAIIVSILMAFGFLTAKFILRRSFYSAITRQPEKMEDALIRHATGAEHIATTTYTRALYKIYQKEVQNLYVSQSRQLEFSNHWVHQMKTPLSVINLLLQEEGELDRESIAEEVNRIQNGLDSVLVNARLETFERDMNIERISLQTLVQEVVTDNKRLLIKSGVFPSVLIDESITVATDVKWIKIAISQFITNAVKYTFERGKKIHITAEQKEREVLLMIRDEGVGIPTSDLNRVTKAFFTGENGRLTGESTGMGLFIASEVCNRLNHHLSIDSELGVGTTVTVVFGTGGLEETNDRKNNGRYAGSNEDL